MLFHTCRRFFGSWNGRLLEWCRIDRFGLVWRLLVGPLSLCVLACIALKWRPVTVALPIAAATTAATPASSPAAVTGFAFAELSPVLGRRLRS